MGRYYLFLDESGNHGLKTIDQNFPLFVLTGVLFSEDSYIDFCRKAEALKSRFFNSKDVILHRRDMRKYERGFEILFNPVVKEKFYEQLNRIMSGSNFKIISSVIDKQKYIENYGKLADDPYEIALTFVLEATLIEADSIPGLDQIHVTIEGRGKKEDALLAKRYNELLYRGTAQIDTNRLLSVYDEELEVRLKKDNDIGLQVADLCAYPIARYCINSSEPNIAFDVIEGKIRRGPKGILGYGVKIFP